MNLDALASLQADELQKLIESLQGLAESRQEKTTPTQQPPISTSAPELEEAIRWEKVGTDQVYITEAPHTRPPPPQEPINKRTLAVANPPSNHRPPSLASIFAELCSKQ